MAGNEAPGYPNVIAARKDSDDTPMDLFLDADTKSLRVNLWVYDTETTSWVRMLQPDVSLSEGVLVRDARHDYSSGDLVYRGINGTHNAATAATTWKIWKYTYGADGIDRIEGPLDGSWNGRAGLSWG
ncbi:MAG: hypothetical protein BBJ57_02230 [Desulfobacterales bacterium PC51MH44]|nr:MAG: hypothetical protein BBJ57_02230 [Desulfobacterales bacterium PC51MH44]